MRFSTAISTVVTVVIIVIVSVSLVSAYYLFIQGYVSRTASAAESTSPQGYGPLYVDYMFVRKYASQELLDIVEP